MIKKLLGIFFISLPVIVLCAVIAPTLGFFDFLFVLSVPVVVLGSVFLGVWLLDDK